MLNKRGPAVIGAVIGAYVIIHFALAGDSLDAGIAGPVVFGGVAYLLMSCSMVLATRAPFLENAFGGLDRMYQVHKFCGVFALLAILPHFFLAPDELPAGADPDTNSLSPSAPLGMIAMILLILSLAITINRKISYSKWRPMHKAMGLVYVLATLHFLLIPTAFSEAFGPSVPLLFVAGAIGLISFLYATFGMHRRTAIEYKIDEVISMERATEIVLSPVGEPLEYTAGQFAFVEVQGKGWNEPHPFTISSSPGDDRLRFTIKVLGDWTRKVREELEPGRRVLVRGPYGRFDTTTAGNDQVWLAGGIGLTPFLSSLRDMDAGDERQVHLVYATRDESEAIYLDELRRRADELGNVTVVPLFSNDGDFARVDMMKTKLPNPLDTYDYFLCGPKPMVAGLSKDLKSEGVDRAKLHTEAFEFR